MRFSGGAPSPMPFRGGAPSPMSFRGGGDGTEPWNLGYELSLRASALDSTLRQGSL